MFVLTVCSIYAYLHFLHSELRHRTHSQQPVMCEQQYVTLSDTEFQVWLQLWQRSRAEVPQAAPHALPAISTHYQPSITTSAGTSRSTWSSRSWEAPSRRNSSSPCPADSHCREIPASLRRLSQWLIDLAKTFPPVSKQHLPRSNLHPGRWSWGLGS